ncbi:MAG: Holliday junction resolvase RuvX [bacterium TMED217]|nr:MAG: Holliday junction resolvase RuvX [bacterium TMED217]|tara:strand:- start:2719 stop:3132 length:414 start_codon:yes stop_codon:yes gene_type:complete
MGRFLGIDFGEKRVGLALSDRSKLIASPFKTLNYFNQEDLVNQLREIVIEHDIENFVLGLPINMKGEDTKQTEIVRNFKKSLSILDIPIIYEDERFSSVSAKNSLMLQNIKTGYNKHEIDKTAAAIILQQYLDKNSN